MNTISIASDFSDVPAGRHRVDGPWSGEAFREDLLAPAIEQAIAEGDTVSVDLDGVEGFGSSFLDEAFGGLVRYGYASSSQLRAVLTIRHSERGLSLYESQIWEYVSANEADRTRRTNSVEGTA